MRILKNLLKSTVFVGGALSAMPVIATTITIGPNSANLINAWNNTNVETILFSTPNGVADPSTSRAGGIILTGPLPVPPRAKVLDASNLLSGSVFFSH